MRQRSLPLSGLLLVVGGLGWLVWVHGWPDALRWAQLQPQVAAIGPFITPFCYGLLTAFLVAVGLRWLHAWRRRTQQHAQQQAQQQVRRERDALAYEVQMLEHGPLKAGVRAVGRDIEAVQALIPPEQEAAQVRLTAAIQRNQALLAQVMTLYDDARHRQREQDVISLFPDDIHATLQQLTTDYTGEGLPCTFTTQGVTVPLPTTISKTLTLAAVVVLENAQEHARAQRVTVRLQYAPDQALLIVSDDGQGFAPGQITPAARRGHGLTHLEYMVTTAGGTVTVASQPGQGTTVTVVFPLPSTVKGTSHAELVPALETSALVRPTAVAAPRSGGTPPPHHPGGGRCSPPPAVAGGPPPAPWLSRPQRRQR